jgi:hypothetical protein
MAETDAVVVGLKYDKNKEKFYAKTRYLGENNEMKYGIMNVADDWVYTKYGPHFAKKLMDRAKDDEFMKAFTEDGEMVSFKVDDRAVIGIKYMPKSQKDKNGIWHALLEDKNVITIDQSVVKENFGYRYMEECKKLGRQKFVFVPTGDSRNSVMEFCPWMMEKGAPEIKFRQGERDTCVFDSLASALYQTNVVELKVIAHKLFAAGRKHEGGADSLFIACKIVRESVRWLQPVRMRSYFDWRRDITNNMFVLAVIEDSSQKSSHAVTLFRNWIFDSNEPKAIPLTKQGLDSCTWEIKNGVLINSTVFVKFKHGWIFQELRENGNLKHALPMVCF